jgi:hypothetical protein
MIGENDPAPPHATNAEVTNHTFLSYCWAFGDLHNRPPDQILFSYGKNQHAMRLVLDQIFNATYLDAPARTSMQARAVELFGAETYFSESKRWSMIHAYTYTIHAHTHVAPLLSTVPTV